MKIYFLLSHFLKGGELYSYDKTHISRKTLIILLTVKLIMKIYLFLLGLYLIVKFAEFITFIIIR